MVCMLEDALGFRVPMLRFGSSDYHRSRSIHLFYSKSRPSFRRFRKQVIVSFEGVEVEQQIFSPATEEQRRHEPTPKAHFICSENRMRSLTAEAMYQGFPGYAVRTTHLKRTAVEVKPSREAVKEASRLCCHTSGGSFARLSVSTILAIFAARQPALPRIPHPRLAYFADDARDMPAPVSGA